MPLHGAVGLPRIEVDLGTYLLKMGTIIHSVTIERNAPLYTACSLLFGNVAPVANVLLDHSANPEATNKEGKTVLFLALNMLRRVNRRM